MEYVYAGMLLHKAGQEVNESNVKRVLEAAGVRVDDARIKSLVAALHNINIEEAIKEASTVQVTAQPVTQVHEKKEEKKEEKKPAEEAAQGLGLLFG